MVYPTMTPMKMTTTDATAQAVDNAVLTAGNEMTPADTNGLVTLVLYSKALFLGVCFGSVKTNMRIHAAGNPVQIVYGTVSTTIDYINGVLCGAYNYYYKTSSHRVKWYYAAENRVNALFGEMSDAKKGKFATDFRDMCTYLLNIDPTTGTGVENERFNAVKEYVTNANASHLTLDGKVEKFVEGKGKIPMVSMDNLSLAPYLPDAHEWADETLASYLFGDTPDMKLIGTAEPVDHAAKAAGALANLRKVTKQ